MVYAFILTLLLLLGLMTWLAMVLWRFNHHPLTLLSKDVLQRQHQVSVLLEKANVELELQKREWARQVDELREAALSDALASIDCTALHKYPGIGEGTTGKLAAEGILNLKQLKSSQLQSIPGIGPSREREIRSAAQQLEKDLLKEWQQAGHPAARALAAKLKQKDIEAKKRQNQLLGRLHALRQIERKMAIAIEHARKVDFFTYLNRRFGTIPKDEMEAALQINLEATIAKGEAKFIEEMAVVDQEAEMPPTTEQQNQPRRSTTPTQPTSTSAANVSRPTEQPVSASGQDLFLGSHSSVSSTKAPDRPKAKPTEAPPMVQPVIPSALDQEAAFHRAAIAFGCAMARVHGRFSKAEKEVIYEYIQKKAMSNEVLRNRCLGWLAQYEREAIDWQNQLDQMEHWLTAEQRQEVLDLATAVAEATGGIQLEEAELLSKLRQRWSITPPTMASIPASAQKSESIKQTHGTYAEESPRKLLEIPDEAKLTPELIRRQYNLLSQRLDPKRAANIDPEVAALVEQKRAKVEQAARQLLASLGEPWEVPQEPEKPKDLRYNPDLDELFGDMQ